MTDEEMAAASSAPSGGLTDEQMMAPEEGGPESFLDPKKFKPSKGQRKFKNTGPIEDVRQQLDPRQIYTPDAGEALAGPALDYMDKGSFGGLGAALRLDRSIADNPLARAVSGIPGIGPIIGKRGGETSQRALDSMQGYRQQNPTLSQYTGLPAYLAKPQQAVAEAIGGATARLPLGAIQRTIVGGAATSGINSAMQTASEGASPGEIAESLGEGAAGGLAVATPLSVAGRAVGGFGRAVQGSKGAQARRFIEERGGGARVGPGTPGRGGKFDEMASLEPSDANIGRQAEESASKGLGMLNEEKKGVLTAVGRRIGNAANTPEAAQLHDVSSVVSNLESSLAEIDTAPQTRAAINDALSAIKSKQGQGFNPDTDNYMLSETDVNKLKRLLDRHAKTGLSTDERFHPLREAANEVRGIVNEGPFAEPNAEYAKESKHYQESRGLLGINKRPKTPEEAQASVSKVKNLITRRGQQTVTAGGQEGRLNEFEARHPDIAEEFIKPELLRKRADIGFHLFPQHGGLIDRTAHPIASVALHGMLGGATGLLPMLAYTNRNAIAARLLYGPALAAQAAEPLLLNQVPLLAAGRRLEDR